MAQLTEAQVRAEYNEQRKDPTFASCYSESNFDFYNWCSQYLDYQHIKNPEIEKMKGAA
mgnify:FL=1